MLKGCNSFSSFNTDWENEAKLSLSTVWLDDHFFKSSLYGVWHQRKRSSMKSHKVFWYPLRLNTMRKQCWNLWLRNCGGSLAVRLKVLGSLFSQVLTSFCAHKGILGKAKGKKIRTQRYTLCVTQEYLWNQDQCLIKSDNLVWHTLRQSLLQWVHFLTREHSC